MANTHLFWDPKYPEVKIGQASALISSCKKFMRSQGIFAPLIVCGDFNILPNSNVYQLFVRGESSVSFRSEKKNIVDRAAFLDQRSCEMEIAKETVREGSPGEDDLVHRVFRSGLIFKSCYSGYLVKKQKKKFLSKPEEQEKQKEEEVEEEEEEEVEEEEEGEVEEEEEEEEAHKDEQISDAEEKKKVNGLEECLNADHSSDKEEPNINLEQTKGREPEIKTEPEFTNFTKDFKGCLDYIFYAQSTDPGAAKIKPQYLLEIIARNRARSEIALPNSKWPSDHVAIAAIFSWLIEQEI